LRAEKKSCFLDLFNKFIEVHQISTNFLNRQIDKHSSDLRCLCFSSNLFYELKDSITNLSFVVRVVWVGCRYQGVCFSHVLLVQDWELNIHLRHRSNKVHLVAHSLVRHHILHSWLWNLRHTSWLLWHSHILVWEWGHVVWHHHTLTHRLGHTSWARLWSLSVVVVLVLLSLTSIASSAHVASSLASLSVLQFWLHQRDKLSKDSENLGSVHHVS